MMMIMNNRKSTIKTQLGNTSEIFLQEEDFYFLKMEETDLEERSKFLKKIPEYWIKSKNKSNVS